MAKCIQQSAGRIERVSNSEAAQRVAAGAHYVRKHVYHRQSAADDGHLEDYDAAEQAYAARRPRSTL